MSRAVVTSLYCHNYLISLIMLDCQRKRLMRTDVKRREVWEWRDHTRLIHGATWVIDAPQWLVSSLLPFSIASPLGMASVLLLPCLPRINPFDSPGLDAYHVPRVSWSSTTPSATARRPVRLHRFLDRTALSTLRLKAPLAPLDHLPVPGTLAVLHGCGVNRRPVCLQGRTWPEPGTQAVEAQ